MLPELDSLDQRRQLVRIPHEMDVPLTPRVVRLIDTAQFRRLSKVSQLGLVTLVYPGATHTRFEHSLGVYRNALLYLKQLSDDPRFASQVDARAAERLIVAALLHDVGHWPFCHPIEDIRPPRVPRHEQFVRQFLEQGELADLLRSDWRIEPAEIVALLSEKPASPQGRLLGSILSGPIDIDKMDYLVRDSLHAGVPYGRHFDQQRLIGSLCLNAAGDGLAINEKGRTAAEMMVFARYVMFSEVYWHHTVRSATAMLQRAFTLLEPLGEVNALFTCSEPAFIEQLLKQSEGKAAQTLLGGLFGPRRQLYKRLAEFSFYQERELYERIARKPYSWLCRLAERVAEGLSSRLGRAVAAEEVLIDAPPVKREVEFSVDVYFPKEGRYRPLGEVSPAIHTLATRQFDDFVKRVRVFVHPGIAKAARELTDVQNIIANAVTIVEQGAST